MPRLRVEDVLLTPLCTAAELAPEGEGGTRLEGALEGGALVEGAPCGGVEALEGVARVVQEQRREPMRATAEPKRQQTTAQPTKAARATAMRATAKPTRQQTTAKPTRAA